MKVLVRYEDGVVYDEVNRASDIADIEDAIGITLPSTISPAEVRNFVVELRKYNSIAQISLSSACSIKLTT
jgi:hypothetical protein